KPVCGTSMWKKTRNQPPLPPIIRKIPGRPRKNKIKSPFKTTYKGRGSRGGGRGKRGAHAGRGGSGRVRVGLQSYQEVEEDELRNALDQEHMEQLIIKEEEKRLAREKEILEFKMDVDAINKTPTLNKLNVNTQEYVVFHNASDVVEPVVAKGLVQDQIIDKVVVVKEGVSVSSNTRGRSEGNSVANKHALPFRIYHKNRGRSERIAKMQAKKFKIDDSGTSLSADKALSLSESK
nr:chloramphenicol acetyltransferase-like domain-containing protein [Tanacetum cinerariifolium]